VTDLLVTDTVAGVADLYLEGHSAAGAGVERYSSFASVFESLRSGSTLRFAGVSEGIWIAMHRITRAGPRN
jgi:hypothetical protein